MSRAAQRTMSFGEQLAPDLGPIRSDLSQDAGWSRDGLFPDERARGRERRTRLLVADDDKRFADAVMRRLNGRPVSVSVVERADRVVDEVARLDPQLLLLANRFDRSMGPGAPLVQSLRQKNPRLNIILLARDAQAVPSPAREAISWGALGVLEPDEILRGDVLTRIVQGLAAAGA